MRYKPVFKRTKKGGYNVSFPSLPGCVSYGKNIAEAKQKAQEILQLWLEEIAELKESQKEISRGKGKLLRSLADLR